MDTKKTEEKGIDESNLCNLVIKEGYDISRVVIVSQDEQEVKFTLYFQTENHDYYFANARVDKRKLKKM